MLASGLASACFPAVAAEDAFGRLPSSAAQSYPACLAWPALLACSAFLVFVAGRGVAVGPAGFVAEAADRVDAAFGHTCLPALGLRLAASGPYVVASSDYRPSH